MLVALSMRAAIGVVGPLFSAMADDLGLESVVLAFIAAAPPLAFALAGLVVPPLARRFGLEAALLLALAALVLGQAARAVSGDAVAIVGSTFLAVLGIGATNVLLPPLVRRWFPGRIAGATSVYLALVAVSAAAPAFVAVQLADGLGWRVAIALWIALPLLAMLPWLALRRAGRSLDDETTADTGVGPASGARPRVWTSPTAWALVAVLLLPSVSIYTAAAILPTVLVETAELSPAGAGAAMGIVYLLGGPLAFLVPLVRRHPGATLPLIAAAGASTLLGWGGLLVAPAAAPFVWATLIGLGPITFPLSLYLVNVRSRTERTTVELSGFVQGLAYVTAGIAGLGLGLLHDVTHSWVATMILLAATSLVVVPGIVVLARSRFVDDELRRRES